MLLALRVRLPLFIEHSTNICLTTATLNDVHSSHDLRRAIPAALLSGGFCRAEAEKRSDWREVFDNKRARRVDKAGVDDALDSFDVDPDEDARTVDLAEVEEMIGPSRANLRRLLSF